MNRLLFTGASGQMASCLRPYLSALAHTVVLSGRKPIDDLLPHEINCPADLSSLEQTRQAVKGCDAILHLGGYSVEGDFEPILEANIVGVYSLYEAARLEGQPRILFASSNHVTGYYSQAARLKNDVPTRPDSLYGVSKCFGESLASFYFDKYGQETAIVRIGSCLAKPFDRRTLSTWISHGDFVSLMERVFSVPLLGCPIIYGASNNDRSWWDNANVGYLGWAPKDNSECYAEEICAEPINLNPKAAINRFQGGKFITMANNQELPND